MQENKFLIENSYGIIRTFDKGDIYLEDLYFKGFTILDGVFDEKVLSEAKVKIEEVAKIEAGVCVKSEVSFESDEDNIRCPLAYDEFFLKLAYNKTIINLIEKSLGANFVLLMQNAIINRPLKKQYQARWHRDLNYQHWTSTQPLAFNFLIMLDDFKVENGCTWVLPGTHLRSEFPSERYVVENEVPIVGKAGSVAVLDAMLYHRAGRNITKDSIRRGLNHVVGLPMLAQQIDIPNFIKESRGASYERDDFLSGYLGYKWNPAKNCVDWRKKRVKK